MRPEILEKTYKLRNELIQITQDLPLEIDRDTVLNVWQEYTPKPTKSRIVAEDGSFNKKQYLGFYLYTVDGYSVLYDGDSLKRETVLGEVYFSVIKKTERVDTYIKFLMFLVELKSLLKLAMEENPDILMFDGTLSARFIALFPKTEWFSPIEFDGNLTDIATTFIDRLKENLFEEDITAFSKAVKDEAKEKIVKNLGKNYLRQDVLEALIAKIAYFEYIILLHTLFFKLNWQPVIIGVAKTSHSTEIFNSSIPDIRIFHSFITETGYSKPFKTVKLSERKWEFSEMFEERQSEIVNQLKNLELKYFYGKYDSRKVISLIEVYRLNGEVSPEEILDVLSYYSVGGYPFPLRRSDKEARITKKDMDMIASILGLKNEVHGREGLGQ